MFVFTTASTRFWPSSRSQLLAKYVKAGPPELTKADLNPPTKIGGDPRDADKPMAFSY